MMKLTGDTLTINGVEPSGHDDNRLGSPKETYNRLVGEHPEGHVLSYNGRTASMEWIDPNPPAVEESEFPSYGCKRYIQRTVGDYNPTLNFGPMSTKLSDLFDRGYHLEVIFMHHQQKAVTKRRPSLYLVGDGKRYCICKILWSRFITNRQRLGEVDLIHYVVDGRDFMASQSPAPNYWVDADPKDPWEQIMAKYPAKRVKMIGNRTVREHLEDSLGVLP